MPAPRHAAKKHKRTRANRSRTSWNMPAAMRNVKKPMLLGSVLLLASIITLMLVVLPGAGTARDSLVRTMSLTEQGNLEIKGVSLAERAIDQKNQIHMQESAPVAGDIPYQDVWVLNDPFFPLIGNPGTLRDDTGTLDSKLAHITGRPVPPAPLTQSLDAGGNLTTGATGGTGGTTGATVGTMSAQTGNVLLVEQITESRGIMYARIKVGSQVYDNIRAGTAFAEVYKIAEFKDYQTVVILCGDERYELQVGQLRRI